MSPQATRPLLLSDLALQIPEEWTVEAPIETPAGVKVGLRFGIEAPDNEVFVGRHRAPRFDGAILIELERTEEPLEAFFERRMASFSRNLSSARVVSTSPGTVGGAPALVREHLVVAASGALLRHRIAITIHQGWAYILGTTNAAGPLFDGAAKALEARMKTASWCAEEN